MIINGIALIFAFATAMILFLYDEPSCLYLSLIPKEKIRVTCEFLRRMQKACEVVFGVSIAFLSVRLFIYLLGNFSRDVQIAFAGFGYFLLLCFFGLIFSAIAMLGVKCIEWFSDYMREHYLPQS